MNKEPLKYNDVCFNLNRKALTNNSNINTEINFLGQEKAIEVLNFGLELKSKGYNIFLSGELGTHKQEQIKQFIEKYAKESDIPNDWCYVYSFEN